MDFLKELFKDKALTYDELLTAIDAHNGNEANKENQLKIGNLGTGEYVGKAKYDALQAALDGKSTELDSANGLIAELKKDTKGNEELQNKITGYETQVADLQAELAETKLKSAVKVALLSEHATDVPYMTFKIEEKLKEQGKTLELDENENIKGWDDLLSGLKTQFPTMFEGSNKLKPEPNPLPQPNPNDKGITKEEFEKMGYSSRAKLRAENPEAYERLAK